MLETILAEAVNGWILTIYGGKGKLQFVYETLAEAQEHRHAEEIRYEYRSKKGVRDASLL